MPRTRSPTGSRAISFAFTSRAATSGTGHRSASWTSTCASPPGSVARATSRCCRLASSRCSTTPACRCIASQSATEYPHYMGWHLTVTVPWQNALGLAISGPCRPFQRNLTIPGRQLNDSVRTPSRIRGSRSRTAVIGWYGSNTQWGRRRGQRHLIKRRIGRRHSLGAPNRSSSTSPIHRNTRSASRVLGTAIDSMWFCLRARPIGLARNRGWFDPGPRDERRSRSAAGGTWGDRPVRSIEASATCCMPATVTADWLGCCLRD